MSENSGTIAVTGDFQLNKPLNKKRESKTGEVYGVLRDADWTFTNLETPLTRRGLPTDKLITFRSPPELASQLSSIGVDVVTIANNHALDYGTDGLSDTMEALAAVGVSAVGAGVGPEEAFQAVVIQRKTLRVAFLGMATTLPAGYAARGMRLGIAPMRVSTSFVVDNELLEEQPGSAPYVETRLDQESVIRATEAVRQAKTVADHVVVGIHWGVPNGFVAPFQHQLANYQVPLGHALIDAGATVVVGNHAHVLHGIEAYRSGLIFYSLGNFVFHRLSPDTPVGLQRTYPPYDWTSQRSRINRLSCLPLLELEASGIRAVELMPLVINNEGEPEAALSDEADRILTDLVAMSTPFGTRIQNKEGRGWLN